jgi:hypothetical protein
MNTLQIGVVTLKDKNGNMIAPKLKHMHMLVTHSTITWSNLFQHML